MSPAQQGALLELLQRQGADREAETARTRVLNRRAARGKFELSQLTKAADNTEDAM
jgi:hypothetical protein